MSTDVKGETTIDLDAEQEIDLRSAWTRIRARWWIPLAGLLVGAVVGVLFAAASTSVYDAKALLYMGQPFTPGGGGQLQNLQTNPRTVSEILSSEEALDAASEASGMTRAELKGNVSSAPVTVSQGATARNLSPLIEVRVKASERDAAEAAATSLTSSIVDAVRGYTDAKVKLIERQLGISTDALERVERRLDRAYQQQEDLARNTSLPGSERLIVLQSINAIIAASEAQRITLQSEITGGQQLLQLANEVERPQVVLQPVAVKTSATSSRNAAIIGGLIGLLLGALVAYAIDPVLRRRAAQTAG